MMEYFCRAMNCHTSNNSSLIKVQQCSSCHKTPVVSTTVYLQFESSLHVTSRGQCALADSFIKVSEIHWISFSTLPGLGFGLRVAGIVEDYIPCSKCQVATGHKHKLAERLPLLFVWAEAHHSFVDVGIDLGTKGSWTPGNISDDHF